MNAIAAPKSTALNLPEGMPLTAILKRVPAFAVAIVLSLAITAMPIKAFAGGGGGRSQSQDHRLPNTGGQALPEHSHSCVFPFCGNDFSPHGRRPQSQDHRPGPNVPPIVPRS